MTTRKLRIVHNGSPIADGSRVLDESGASIDADRVIIKLDGATREVACKVELSVPEIDVRIDTTSATKMLDQFVEYLARMDNIKDHNLAHLQHLSAGFLKEYDIEG